MLTNEVLILISGAATASHCQQTNNAQMMQMPIINDRSSSSSITST